LALGAMVRRSFGPYERQVSELWRSIFFDLDEWVNLVAQWTPKPNRILELGCGEGYSTERLVRQFPDSEILAIDIAPNIGRLYNGDPERVTFRVAYVEDLAKAPSSKFDLIILADVLHHVPESARISMLEAARKILAPGGVLAFKDWERRLSPIHAIAYGADRWLTGDRISYLTLDEARRELGAIFGVENIGPTTHIRPWAHNFAFRVSQP